MPELRDDFMKQIFDDAMKKPVRYLVIDKPESEWNQEDLAYVARQTCGPYLALGFYGYQVFYLGLVDEEYRYQIKRDNNIVADVPASQLEEIIQQIVNVRRADENAERKRLLSE